LVASREFPVERSNKEGDQAIGRSRGGLSTKIHALIDAQLAILEENRARNGEMAQRLRAVRCSRSAAAARMPDIPTQPTPSIPIRAFDGFFVK
jgi:hypothetical protein